MQNLSYQNFKYYYLVFFLCDKTHYGQLAYRALQYDDTLGILLIKQTDIYFRYNCYSLVVRNIHGGFNYPHQVLSKILKLGNIINLRFSNGA